MKNMNKKKIAAAVFLFLLLLGIGCFFFMHQEEGGGSFSPSAPAVSIETPDKKSENDREPFSLKLSLTSFKDELYPAASFSIRFDPAKLEFLGIDEGNVLIRDAESSSGTNLPDWSVNVERSNETGIINIMYLDMTGGKYAFSKELLRDENNVLLFLNFRLRGSCQSGDILELSFDDAVFAANDETKSLASSTGALKTRDGKIVIGG